MSFVPGVQKKYKKKRTIANLLQTDNTITSNNEKKTYIKEYFEHTPPKTPDSVNESLSIENTTVDNSANEKSLDTTGEALKSEASVSYKKSKIKDYVFDGESDISVAAVGSGGDKSTSAVSKLIDESEVTKNNIQRKRISRVRQRKSKIKDYISNENANKVNTPIELIQNKNWINMIKIPIVKPKIIQLTKLTLSENNQSDELMEANNNYNSPKKQSANKHKAKRTKPKIKDYMLGSNLQNKFPVVQKCAGNLNLFNYNKKTISNMIPTKIANSVNSNTNRNKVITDDKTNTKSSKKMMHLYATKKTKSETSSVTSYSSLPDNDDTEDKDEIISTASKSTIKEYLQDRILLQTKCSRAKLIKNKENLNQL